jgi:hypothetical protein
MNTTVRQTVDSEKKVWAQPVLTRLEVGETASKQVQCTNDSEFPGAALCNS